MDLKSYIIKILLAKGKFVVNNTIERRPVISLAFPKPPGMISYHPQLLRGKEREMNLLLDPCQAVLGFRWC